MNKLVLSVKFKLKHVNLLLAFVEFVVGENRLSLYKCVITHSTLHTAAMKLRKSSPIEQTEDLFREVILQYYSHSFL